ncbi:MAG: hypothetical protein ACOX56_05160 [Acholeplasmataceae bacterium]|jgi:hypothetical protein
MEVVENKKKNPYFYLYMGFAHYSLIYSLVTAIMLLVISDGLRWGHPAMLLLGLVTLFLLIVSFIFLIIYFVKSKEEIYQKRHKTVITFLILKLIPNLLVFIFILIIAI